MAGKKHTFRVVWYAEGGHDAAYIDASKAQEAVDIALSGYAPENAEIVEVARLVNGWRQRGKERDHGKEKAGG